MVLMPSSNATVHASAAKTRVSELLPFLLTPTDADKNHIITHICIYKIHRLSIIRWKSRSCMDWNQPMATHIHALYWMRSAICYRSIQSLFKHMCDSHSTKAARRLCANMITCMQIFVPPVTGNRKGLYRPKAGRTH